MVTMMYLVLLPFSCFIFTGPFLFLTREDMIAALGGFGYVLAFAPVALFFSGLLSYAAFFAECSEHIDNVCVSSLMFMKLKWWDLGHWLFNISPEISGNWWIVVFWIIYGPLIFFIVIGVIKLFLWNLANILDLLEKFFIYMRNCK